MGLSSRNDDNSEMLQEDEIYITSASPVRSQHRAQAHLSDHLNSNGNSNAVHPITPDSQNQHQQNLRTTRKFRISKKKLSGKGSDDHPPPVIALSRSSFSNGSASSADSALETTEVDRHHHGVLRKSGSKGYGCGYAHGEDVYRSLSEQQFRTVRRSVRNAVRNDENNFEINMADNASLSPPQGQLNNDSVDYAVRHELLINALFEDARHRQQLRARATSNNKHVFENAQTPPRPVRSTSVSVASASKSIASRRSSTSASSNSDILYPSAHQFKNTLTSKRKTKHSIMILSALKRKRCHPSRNRSNSLSSHSKASSIVGQNSPMTSASSAFSNSSIASRTTLTQGTGSGGDLAQSFLHTHCSLQKDSGKGMDPGKGVNTHGRENAMAKLVEKMDILGEVATNSELGVESGQFGTVNLTRVPAKNMTVARQEASNGNGDSLDQRFVETRSMLALKMGFLSMRYGFLVHWNVETGLAELVVLRKMCLESFMKVKSNQKAKTKNWRKKLRRMSQSADGESLQKASSSCPSMISSESTESNDLQAVQTDPY